MKRISSNSPFEDIAAYSRAVVDENYIFMSGTVGTDPETGTLPETVHEQMNNIFHVIRQTLATESSDLSKVVRCVVYIAHEDYVMEVIKELKDVFDEYRPANTTMICKIPAPGAKVEIEVTAKKG